MKPITIRGEPVQHDGMQVRQLLTAGFCIFTLAACTGTPQDAWQARYNAGQKASQDKNRPLAINEFETAAQLARAELSTLAPTNKIRRLLLQNRLADTEAALAKIKLDEGDLVGARQHILRALALREKLAGRNSESVATLLSALATVAYEQDKFAEAEKYARQAYEIRLKVLGDEHPHVAIAANNLAEVYQKQGKDTDAEEMFEQAVTIYKNSDNQPGVLDVLNNMAMFYKKLGRWRDAKNVIDIALELERVEGNTSTVDRAMTLNALGAVNKAMYEYDEAEKNYREAIVLLDKDEKNNGAALCDALDNYGDFLLMQSEYDKAEKVFLRAIDMCEKSLGKKHTSTAERLTDIGILYKNKGNLKAAESALLRALEIQKHTFDVDSPVMLQTLYKLSAVYKAEKKYDKASELYANLLPELEKRYGNKHPYVADVLENWAAVLEQSPTHAAQVKQLQARAATIRGKKSINTVKDNTGRPQTPQAPAPGLFPKEVES